MKDCHERNQEGVAKAQKQKIQKNCTCGNDKNAQKPLMKLMYVQTEILNW